MKHPKVEMKSVKVPLALHARLEKVAEIVKWKGGVEAMLEEFMHSQVAGLSDHTANPGLDSRPGHFVRVVGIPGAALTGQFLQGPRTPSEVRRKGYGFTADSSKAWAFDSAKQALAKAAIVSRHMGGAIRLQVTAEALQTANH